MIKCFILATFLIIASSLYQTAQDYGFFTNTSQFAILACIAFIALAGLTKLLTR
ncbi:hypothetical protein KAR91_39550 [Candidatus Pacearchaeota archaeon]|nr:hypothetical protein [Candidatus Pacearchaeota archaeon]